MHDPIKMDPATLESILKHMPEPDAAVVGLVGFNYDPVLNQAAEILPEGTQLDVACEPFCDISHPEKERILEIHRKFFGKTEATSPDPPTLPGVRLYEISWYERDRAAVLIYGEGIKVRYFGEEPDFITKMKEELGKPGVNFKGKLEIWVNPSSLLIDWE